MDARLSIGRKAELMPKPVISPADALTIEQVGKVREAIERDIEERFWSIVDQNGLASLPSDMWAALEILARRK